MLIHFAVVSSHLYFVQNAINSSWASFALTPAWFAVQCNRWTIFAPDRTRQVWNRNESSPRERVMHDAAQPKRLVQKRIISVWFHSRVSTVLLCLVQKWIISLNAIF